jgi:cytochrome c oxidase subunit IV
MTPGDTLFTLCSFLVPFTVLGELMLILRFTSSDITRWNVLYNFSLILVSFSSPYFKRSLTFAIILPPLTVLVTDALTTPLQVSEGPFPWPDPKKCLCVEVIADVKE